MLNKKLERKERSCEVARGELSPNRKVGSLGVKWQKMMRN